MTAWTVTFLVDWPLLDQIMMFYSHFQCASFLWFNVQLIFQLSTVLSAMRAYMCAGYLQCPWPAWTWYNKSKGKMTAEKMWTWNISRNYPKKYHEHKFAHCYHKTFVNALKTMDSFETRSKFEMKWIPAAPGDSFVITNTNKFPGEEKSLAQIFSI